jgi:phospholipid-binding lipoprotein MlaA
MDHPMTHIKKTIVSVLLFGAVLCVQGCASQPQSQTAANSSNSTSNNAVQKQSVSPAEQASLGQQQTLTTSSGEVIVKPTVIAPVKEDTTIVNNELVYNDPLESINRAVFTFNHYSYSYVLSPLASAYDTVTPDPVQDSIGNIFDNLREPLNLLNNALSGEGNKAGANLGRFLINSTVGLLGIFDPASAWFEIEPEKKRINDVLATYNVGTGAYIVLPFLGPSDARSTSSFIVEGLVHPTKAIFSNPELYYVRGVDAFDDFSEQSELYLTLYEQASDPYIYFRNQYIQAQLRNQLYLKEENRSLNDDELSLLPDTSNKTQENDAGEEEK